MIEWNFPNWISVLLMALAGYGVFLLAVKASTGMQTKPTAQGNTAGVPNSLFQ